ncbi:MAG: hypothetical protein Q8P41_10550 [Pseudomonadota bacterium]|nr:hypothetical protein [Pseudomonadota bacterium]
MTILLALACAQPVHYQYDFGRASWESARIQADLARESVAESVYPLSGMEAAKMRENVDKSTSDEESGEIESTK